MAIERASAIIDGEVVRAYVPGRQSALVRPARIRRGPSQEYFQVGERDSCDSALLQVGVRMRMLLVGGPDLYFLPYTGAEDRYVDRLLQSDRRRVWPNRAGTELRE